MKVRLTAVAIAVAIVTTSVRSEDNKAPAGFTALFNGKDLTGWKGHTTMTERAKQKPEDLAKLQATRTKTAFEHWKLVDGAIHCDGKGGVSLVTEKDYGNFELLVDWKIAKKGDSGLYLRGQPQVQIWDSDNAGGGRIEDPGTGSGGLWNNPLPPNAEKSADVALRLQEGRKVGKVPLTKADKPVGEWNTFHITVIGDEVTVKLNGTLVVDKAKLLNFWERGKPVPETGPIELQFHGDPLWFKNIYIKELKKS
ncbi:hypothetical protein GobsT_33210 [Gemmata obscuriglobus]|uniref:DUF1080 domain-containing protein n=1 Tax=Gemmata obscuriglobus TaxID=114 RepID=A0A2Z3HBB4_9BACT|nr:DUF1080 domain-containing protein [Gemmata obscuriglobus]AWM38510.1 DUF1080 domain-containing protein [Gemmata obscuriglobus]QEG28539.1 hypothetical protein GobsT_33210 [Gemmata obscuriglobus]VTS06624.1 Uncharacterized protein OS=Planctomyces maris DSM 8797 GN=PM8797T_11786 PE=4 SV=1: DUF1080 [Gemmata obscuriglobus UQM 2246]